MLDLQFEELTSPQPMPGSGSIFQYESRAISDVTAQSSILIDHHTRPALHRAVTACCLGDIDSVRSFLRNYPSEIDSVSVGHDNRTLLYEAARNGHTDIVRLLLNPSLAGLDRVHPADVRKRCGRNKCTPLHAAAFHGMIDTVRVLFNEFLAPVDVHNDLRLTPIDEATPEVFQSVFHMYPAQNRNKVMDLRNGEIGGSHLETDPPPSPHFGDMLSHGHAESVAVVMCSQKICQVWGPA